MTKIYWLTLGTLAVWRITYRVHAEHGPWNWLSRLRKRLGSGLLGNLLDCFYCLSLWIAAPMAWVIGETTLERGLLWPALSAGAIALERVTREPEVPSALYFEESEDPNGMLRR